MSPEEFTQEVKRLTEELEIVLKRLEAKKGPVNGDMIRTQKAMYGEKILTLVKRTDQWHA